MSTPSFRNRPGTSRWWLRGAASVLLAAASFLPALGRGETTAYSGATQITALPYTISTPGTYYLAQDFSVNVASGSAITINASNVTLDLNGHTLANGNGAGTGAWGIVAPGQNNVTVRNGSIAGFFYGVVYYEAQASGGDPLFGSLVEDVTFLHEYYGAAVLQGTGCRACQCRAVLCGGSPGYSESYGFIVYGSGNSVEDCDVCGQAGSGTFRGIVFVQGSDHFAVNNRLSGMSCGIASFGGTYKYRDNLTSGVAAAYNGGTDAGNNH